MSEIKTLEQYAVARIEELEQQIEDLKKDKEDLQDEIQKRLNEIKDTILNLKAFGKYMSLNDSRFELSVWSAYDEEFKAAVQFFKPYVPKENINITEESETEESTEESTEE